MAVLPRRRRVRSPAAITCAFFVPRSVEGTHAISTPVASARFANLLAAAAALQLEKPADVVSAGLGARGDTAFSSGAPADDGRGRSRSEERRVGKECGG